MSCRLEALCRPILDFSAHAAVPRGRRWLDQCLLGIVRVLIGPYNWRDALMLSPGSSGERFRRRWEHSQSRIEGRCSQCC
ncbi:MAG: hypothetical protein WCA32_00055, partial [Chromatiaceae bacterium]